MTQGVLAPPVTGVPKIPGVTYSGEMASPPWRLAVASVLAVATTLVMPSAQAATAGTGITRWTNTADFAAGTSNGVEAAGGAIKISQPVSTLTHVDTYGDKKTRTYSYGTWQSPWVTTAFPTRTLVPSWSAATPSGTWIRVELRGKTATKTGSWDTIAYWSSSTAGLHRTSLSAQTDDLAKVDVDTAVTNGSTRFTSWQVRVLLARPKGWSATPTIWSIGGVAASYLTRSASVSATTMTADTELAVPKYSQMIHKGEFPQWGGGGEAWCSPTSTSMVLRFFGKGPTAADYSWSPYTDSWVDHAAQDTYDYRYEGTGNWPFNTAYAGRYGLDAFVTRLNNLRDAEAFIKKGIPVVASIAFASGQLAGSPISSSAGHLLVIRGFMKDGRVIVNDPAAASNSTVRRVYNRSQFEKAWLGGSGGTVYVVHPTTTPLPTDTPRW